ncbi:MAG: DUF1538 domain-containing protein [Rhodobacteraceae bacterium]|nr:DUF1538 domain-containing protein [Paracoccaceae bacterium]
MQSLRAGAGLLGGTARDLMPVLLIVAFFQIVVLRQPVDNLADLAIGFLFVLLGLAVFIRGLEMALFPIGEAMAQALAQRGSFSLLMIFAFSLGFGTTIAEPALIAVSTEAMRVMAAAGVIPADAASQTSHADALRYTVAISVGASLMLGVLRILKGWPVHWLIMAGYVIVVALTMVAPSEIIGIAYDSGGVTTSTITVPLVAALGLGLASNVPGRSPLLDGFRLIALASLFPMKTVMGYAQIGAWLAGRKPRRGPEQPNPPQKEAIDEVQTDHRDDRRRIDRYCRRCRPCAWCHRLHHHHRRTRRRAGPEEDISGPERRRPARHDPAAGRGTPQSADPGSRGRGLRIRCDTGHRRCLPA